MNFWRQINSQAKHDLKNILKIWIVYFTLSKIVLFFPHWEIPPIALLNYDLFFLIALLAIQIFRRGRDNRYIYLNIAIFAFLYVSGFLLIFLGEKYAIGNDYLQYYYFVYRKIAIGIITCITIIFILIDYLYHERKLWRKYLIAILVTLSFSLLYYKNFFLNPNYLFQAQLNYLEVFKGLVGMNFLALFFIFLYGYLKLRLDRPISGYVNVIVFGFFVFLAIDSIDNYYNSIQKTIPSLSQVFLIFNLLFFIAVLLYNHLYIHTEFSRFNEDIKFTRRTVSLKLIPRRTYVEQYFLLGQAFLKNLPYQILLRLFMVISILLFLYYYPHGYFKLSFAVLILLTMIMIVYLNKLIMKRTRTKNLNKEKSKQLTEELM